MLTKCVMVMAVIELSFDTPISQVAGDSEVAKSHLQRRRKNDDVSEGILLGAGKPTLLTRFTPIERRLS